MPVIDGIEADLRGEQADVGLGQVFTGQIACVSQQCLQFVEHDEQFIEGFFVSVLGGSKARAVDAVVHRRVDALIE